MAEPWMEALRAGVEAGYWKVECGTGDESPVPTFSAPGVPESPARFMPPQFGVETNTDCLDLILRIADCYGWSVDDTINIIFHRGLYEYTDNGRFKSGRLGIKGNAAADEQCRLLNAYARRARGR